MVWWDEQVTDADEDHEMQLKALEGHSDSCDFVLRFHETGRFKELS